MVIHKMNLKDHFTNCFQRISFEDTDEATANADAKRKCSALNYTASLDLFDNWSTCALLDRNLKKTCDVVHDGKENIYERHLKTKLKSKKLSERHSGVGKMDVKSFIDELPCSIGAVVCHKSETTTDENFQDFLSLFGENRSKGTTEVKPRTFSKSFAPQSCNAKDKRFTKLPETSSKDNETHNAIGFKTARDELNTNAKKYGNCNQNPTGHKRKLGIRRGVGGKFVSPMLSNNDSGEETSKSQEWVNEAADDRLKNIEPRMVDLIKSEIMDSGPAINWNDIAGLEFAKAAIQEAVVWPMLRPDIFTGLRRPPKGILLFGPPGTGKTLIGKCVASQSKSTFFSISASSLTSKWVGDGEKMVRALFTVARCHQPSVIFIDEIDSLLSQRSDSEHESSRRIKTEFLVQLDGATTDNDEMLLVIGATNRPQELDEAARRRFVKRLYIPLPEEKARLQLIERLMCAEGHELTNDDMMEIAKLSDGFSGADMKNLCADASLGPIRSIDVNLIQSIQPTEVRAICMGDFTKALSRVKSSVSPKDLDQYVDWNKTYGSGSF